MQSKSRRKYISLAALTCGLVSTLLPMAAHAAAPAGCPTCVLDYPYISSNPLTSVIFNESEILRGFSPTVAGPGDTVKVWYNDEHALVLGVRRVIVKTNTGSTTNNYPITPLTSNPGSVANPAVGSLILTGDQAGVDLSGRPMFPALYITDITDNPSSTAGDWQFGGTPVPPHAVFGTWKGAVRTVDKTKSKDGIEVMPDADPAKNNWNLGAGDPAPAGLRNEGYGTEVRWNIDDLGLVFGRTYRLYFMVHDGDQNKMGGDSGHACLNVCFNKTPTNRPPVAVRDIYTVNEDSLLTVPTPGVLLNDLDPDTNILSAVLVTGTKHGQLTFNSNGSFTYQPTNNYVGPDDFTYKASDGITNSAPVEVSITVLPLNDPPVARDDLATTPEDVAININVLANDSDLDGDRLTVTGLTQAQHGSVAINPDGSVHYTPARDYVGLDFFTYTINDGHGASASASVTVNVTPVNDDPIARPDVGTTDQNLPVQINVLANDSDPDGDPLTITSVTPGAHGTVTILPSGLVRYTPAHNYFGPDTFNYVISDGRGGSATAPVAITVLFVNVAPLAAPDTVQGAENVTVCISAAALLANDTDPNGDPLTLTSVDPASAQGGIVTMVGNVVSYSPPRNFVGSDTFNYVVTDDQGASANATVTVLVTPPVVAVLEALHLNRQTSLFEERVRVTNPVTSQDCGTMPAVRVHIQGVPTGGTVHNASGQTNGGWFVQLDQPLAPGASAELVIEYHLLNRVELPTPTYEAHVVLPAAPLDPRGTPFRIDHVMTLQSGRVLIEFTSAIGSTYAIQYSTDLIQWKTARPFLTAPATRVQWIDDGPPKTESKPGQGPRFYQVLLLPAP